MDTNSAAEKTSFVPTSVLVVIIAFLVMARVSSKGAFAARIVASLLATAFSALFGVLVSILLALVGKRQSAQWAAGRTFKYTMLAVTGLTFEPDDPKNILGTTRPAVFIGNHQSALDVLMLGCMFPKNCAITAKNSLKYYPILGWFMILSGSVFIKRSNSKDARQAMSGAADAITSMQQSVFMFPEGTRSYAQEPTMLPFKKGAFHLAVQAGVPIVPVVVANYSHLYSFGNWRFTPGIIPMKVLDPIPTTDLTAEDVPALAQRVSEMMLKEHIAVTAVARGQPMAVPAVTRSSISNGAAAATGVETSKSSRA